MRATWTARRLAAALGAAGAIAILAFAAGRIYAAGSLVSSEEGRRVYEVRKVRGPFAMSKILGVVALGGPDGCYAVWNADQVEVYRAGWTEDGFYDAALVWREAIEDIRGVVPVSPADNGFVVYTRDQHAVYKADWFPVP
ncbi:MAG: hypothetical protein BWZ10_03255 [candidate division BRC1 bacterium ADurb.BinA364]|nr:MAG: hypothetical protein BWZ10_03255 [candidate division BRC1 bacterium ADurb.BinA364]